MNEKSLEYTCIFGGGAIRGICYVGAFKAIEELGIKVNTYAGSSVGAIFATLLAVGFSSEELEELFLNVNYELFKDIHFGFGNSFALSKGGIFLETLREAIEKKFYGENYVKGKNPPVKFSDLDKNLVILTTDLKNFKPCEFSRFTTPDIEIAYAVRISSSMPGLMNPVSYNGTLLVDGDLQKSLPMWRLSKNLCPDNGRILEFRLEGDYEGKGKNPLGFINTVYSCITSLATAFIVDTYGKRDKFDYVTLNSGSVILVDFSLPKEKRLELIDIGYNATMSYFQSDLKEKKKILLKQYKILSKSLKQIQKSINANKINRAENELGHLYMSIYRAKKSVDTKFLEIIEEFRETFFSNLLPAGLLGIKHVKNHKLLNAEILRLNILFDEKIMELESFIFDI
ncbi:patatin-like phospholipase family protein [bacterium]|nr:patatin-like phospholipase family protein [bacterium]